MHFLLSLGELGEVDHRVVQDFRHAIVVHMNFGEADLQGKVVLDAIELHRTSVHMSLNSAGRREQDTLDFPPWKYPAWEKLFLH